MSEIQDYDATRDAHLFQAPATSRSRSMFRSKALKTTNNVVFGIAAYLLYYAELQGGDHPPIAFGALLCVLTSVCGLLCIVDSMRCHPDEWKAVGRFIGVLVLAYIGMKTVEHFYDKLVRHDARIQAEEIVRAQNIAGRNFPYGPTN